LQVKQIVRQQTGMHVSCGHEVARGVNYRIRAETAVLNARIIPCLEAFIDDVRESLHARGIDAPEMVVKSDGSLMNAPSARLRPIETILSGPAASVAGARYLVGAADALVVDIGGTTTDTAVIRNGVVATCEDGATVGGWRTLVKALDMRTLGLGGDSLIACQRRKIRIGPGRVAPISWLARQHGRTMDALGYLRRQLDYFDSSTGGMDLLVLNGRDHGLPLGPDEARIVELLREGPFSLHEITRRIDYVTWEFLPLQRLEDSHVVQRCGLTPTDLLHVTSEVDLWDGAAARRAADMFGELSGEDGLQFARRALDQFVRELTVELLKKQMGERVDPDLLNDSPAAMALIENLLDGGSRDYSVRVRLNRPIIGIGAPVRFFLPQAAKLLETEAIIPPNADVANAIGAITSSVCIQKQVEIVPDEVGRYKIEGLGSDASFINLADAQEHATRELPRIVRELARQAGTSQTRVEVIFHDKVATLADGGQLFLGRTMEARLDGRPDLSRIEAAS
jgi:N-methylhydantoinase A/oxoprolinase/acetone carboxylase beta subunit